MADIEKYSINLSLVNNNKLKKTIIVNTNMQYEEILKLASNKFNKKIMTIINKNNEQINVNALENGLDFYCSTKFIEADIAKENQQNVITDIIAIDSYIQDDAINQFKSLKKLEGVTHIFGMPDLHVGGGIPIGSVTITNNVLHPQLIGSDIGCGMSFVKLNLKNNLSDKIIKKMANELNLEDNFYSGDLNEKHWNEQISKFDKELLKKYENVLDLEILDKSIGTIGRGNHFAEMQVVDQIHNDELASKFGITQENIYLTVHSGSRGFGENILSEYSKKTINVEQYKELHDIALLWSKHNRANITKRFTEQIGINEYICIADMYHNYFEQIDNMTIHRKGAAGCDINKLIIIPGSRGTKTYVVIPTKSNITHGFSVSHGAGRKLSRSKASQITDNTEKQNKLKNNFQNIVICEDKKLRGEEESFVYKDIDVVINDLVELGLVTVVASMIPIITYKMRNRF